jgi:hypothetical protein
MSQILSSKSIRVVVAVLIVAAVGVGFFFENQESASSEIDASNWKTYRNEEYGFAFEYPQGSQVTRVGSSDTGESIYEVAEVFTIATMKKPESFSTLEIYVENLEDEYRKQGESAAAGYAAETKQATIGEEKGLRLIENDSSVWVNVNESTYLENNNYIYVIRFGYSRMLLESNKDELRDDYLKERYRETINNQELRNQILSTFRFIL